MWPILLGKVAAAAALVGGGVFLFQQYKQEQERQTVESWRVVDAVFIYLPDL